MRLEDIIKNESGEKSEWYTPEVGENKVRFLSMDSVVLATHWNPSLKKTFTCFGKDKGCPYDIEIDSPVRDENNQIELDVNGKPKTEKKIVHRPGKKYLLWIIDRKDGKVKIGKFTYGVAKYVVDLKNSSDYGYSDIPGCDITIIKTKTGPKTSDVEYNTVPGKEVPLTPAEEEYRKNLGNLGEIVEKMKDKAKKLHESGGENEKDVEEEITDEEL